LLVVLQLPNPSDSQHSLMLTQLASERAALLLLQRLLLCCAAAGHVAADTPSSLLQRGRLDKARHSFKMVRHSSSLRREHEWQGMCSEAHSVLANKQQQQLDRQGSRRQRSFVLRGLQQRDAATEAESDAEAAVLDASVTAEQGLHGVGAASIQDASTRSSGSAAANKQPDLLVAGKSMCDASSAGSDAATAAAAAAAAGDSAAGNAAAAAAGIQVLQGGTGSFWPALIIMLHLTVLRSFNGFVNIMYFTALLFSATGNSTRNALLAQTLMGVSTLLGGVAAMLGIDKVICLRGSAYLVRQLHRIMCNSFCTRRCPIRFVHLHFVLLCMLCVPCLP
jgi:hypothetical protein